MDAGGVAVSVCRRQVGNARLRRPVAVWRKPKPKRNRHSGAGRNPVVLTSHSRRAGMTTQCAEQSKPGKVGARPTSRQRLSSAACSRRRSTTYVPVGVDPGLRRNDDGERTRRVAIPTALSVIPTGLRLATLQPTPRRHSGAGRNPPACCRQGGFNKSFPRSGNDNSRDDHPMRHSIKPVTHSPPRPRFPGFRPSPE